MLKHGLVEKISGIDSLSLDLVYYYVNLRLAVFFLVFTTALPAEKSYITAFFSIIYLILFFVSLFRYIIDIFIKRFAPDYALHLFFMLN